MPVVYINVSGYNASLVIALRSETYAIEKPMFNARGSIDTQTVALIVTTQILMLARQHSRISVSFPDQIKQKKPVESWFPKQ